MTASDSIRSCDCELLAIIYAKFTIFLNIIIGIISLFKYDQYLGLYVLITALFITIWEIPILYSCIPAMDKLREILLEKFYLKVFAVRGMLYLVFAFICFLKQTICIIAGIMLATNALLLFIASMTSQATGYESLIPEDDESSFEEENPGFGFISNQPKDLASAALSAVTGEASTSSKKVRFGTF
jgi:hypothetical protein